MRSRKWLAVSLLAWFFGFRYDIPGQDGVEFVGLVGPIQTQAECEFAYNLTRLQIDAQIEGVKWAECKERNRI